MSLESKLGLKGRHLEVVGAPTPFPVESTAHGEGDSARLVVVRDRAGLEMQIPKILESAGADRLTWVAYPKAGQLGTDLNRDSLAALLVKRGIRPVTQVSLDPTWSALRFRPVKTG